jgi:hypothetical protein
MRGQSEHGKDQTRRAVNGENNKFVIGIVVLFQRAHVNHSICNPSSSIGSYPSSSKPALVCAGQSLQFSLSPLSQCSKQNLLRISPNRLSSVGGSRDVTTAAGPVDVDVLALGVLLVGVLRLDAESVGTEVVTLGLEHVGREVLGAVAVVEGQSGAEGRGRDTPEGALGDDVAPAVLGSVDGIVEEVVEEEVLKVGVAAVGLGDVLEEDGADDAATAPHEGDLGLLELPAVVLGGLR